MTLHNDFKNREDSFLFEYVYNNIVANKTYSKDFFLYLYLRYNSINLHFEIRKDKSALYGFLNSKCFKICNFKINKSDKFIVYDFNDFIIESNLFIDHILKSFHEDINERESITFHFLGKTRFILSSMFISPLGSELCIRYLSNNHSNPDYTLALNQILSDVETVSNLNVNEQKFLSSLYEKYTGVVIDFNNIDKNSEKYLTLFEMLNS